MLKSFFFLSTPFPFKPYRHILETHCFLCFQVTEQVMDEKIGRMVTRVVLPRVVMHSRHHYAVISMEHILYDFNGNLPVFTCNGIFIRRFN